MQIFDGPFISFELRYWTDYPSCVWSMQIYILVLLFLLSLDNGEKTTKNIKLIEPDVSFLMPNDNDNFISTNGPTQKWPVLSRVRD